MILTKIYQISIKISPHLVETDQISVEIEMVSTKIHSITTMKIHFLFICFDENSSFNRFLSKGYFDDVAMAKLNGRNGSWNTVFQF